MPDRIRTEFVHPPIPTRQFDWSAVDDDTYDGAPDAGRRARIIGYGATEAEAIADLNSQMEDDMETKHTPGPWTATKCRCGDRACDQYTISVQGSVGFGAADARLIAASPDILAALLRIQASVRMSDELGALVDAAIAKARGEG